MEGKGALAFLLRKEGCLNPFDISRILALADILSMENKGKRLTDLRYAGMEYAFYIENFEVIIQDKCFIKHEGNPLEKKEGCIEYICGEIDPGEGKEYIEKAIELWENMGRNGINRYIVMHPLYGKILNKVIK